MAHRIVLHSPLPPHALALKLRDMLGDRSAAPKAAGVTGQGSEDRMLLVFYRPNFQNSFATRLSARMSAEGGGTRIAGTIGVATGAIIFLFVWFAFLALFMMVPLIGMSVSHTPIGQMAPFVLIPGGMMVFGALLWIVGTWNGRKDEAAILDFLASTVAARPVAA